MPLYTRGDIFDTLANRPTLGIIFGKVGFSGLSASWGNFKQGNQALAHITDPFTQPQQPMPIGGNKWLWFILAGEDGGLGDAEFIQGLNNAFAWATAHGIRYVVTNGISDVGHSTNTEWNRLSDDRRTRLLVAYVVVRERETGIAVELTSMNDVFIRNAY